MKKDKFESIKAKSKCEVCGKGFTPYQEGDSCCSPFCRTMKRAKDVEQARSAEKIERQTQLDSMTKPPKFNLALNPRARAEWFMSLPDAYKTKFRKFLLPHELDWAKSIWQKKMSEDRFFSGIYIKNGKIIDTKMSPSSNNDKDDIGAQGDEEQDDDDFE